MDPYESEELKQIRKIMKFIYIVVGLAALTALLGASLTSCSSLPLMFQSLDDVLTDEAVVVEVEKAAMNGNTDVAVSVQVTQKDPQQPIIVHPPAAPAPSK
jgi:hypothetical protein